MNLVLDKVQTACRITYNIKSDTGKIQYICKKKFD